MMPIIPIKMKYSEAVMVLVLQIKMGNRGEHYRTLLTYHIIDGTSRMSKGDKLASSYTLIGMSP